MSSPPILEFDTLLTAIPGDNPAGADLRQDRAPGSLYDKIKDARSAARELEKRQERGDVDDKDLRALTPAWRTILDTAPKVLAENSKDLEVTAFLIEALQREHGIVGLRDGFRLACGLVEQFWDNLYPMPDEDGISTRVAPLTGLNGEGTDGTLIKPLRMTELTGDAGGAGPYSYDDFLKATRLLQLNAQDKAQRIAAGDVSMEAFTDAIKQTPPAFYRTLWAELKECIEEYGKFCAALDQRCGNDAPPSSNISGLLDNVRECLRQTAGAVVQLELPPASEEAAAANGEAAPGAAAAGGGPGGNLRGAIASREDALQLLRRVADYFRNAEPQSLVSYVIDDAIRRARLPLPELLAELIPDEGTRNQFFINSGVRPPTS
jgi:type VI secretion system protein ImpA